MQRQNPFNFERYCVESEIISRKVQREVSNLFQPCIKNNPSIPSNKGIESQRGMYPGQKHFSLSVAICSSAADRINFSNPISSPRFLAPVKRSASQNSRDLSPFSRCEHQKASGRRDLRGEILPILEGVEAGLAIEHGE